MSIQILNRRQFVVTGTTALAAARLAGMAAGKPKVGLVQSTHRKLARPSNPEQDLDYPQIREMVWKAIEYGRPAAGSLEAKIKPGSWVVIKPNIVSLKGMRAYRTGDVTDLRVTRAVFEYVAEMSKARRITLAEGGSYRRLTDPVKDNVVMQDGVHRDAATYDWGTGEFPGFASSIDGMLKELSAKHRGKKFDYVDLSYDTVRDPSGKGMLLEVPKLNGVGSFSNATAYYVTNTIRDCDFLITVPVAKVHENCGITACFKSYVGTAPREMYSAPGQFWNSALHNRHSLDTRIDPFIADLAAFHPPDYNVVDAIRGLQYTEHNNNLPDQMVRTNAILAGEDTVAVDAVVAMLLGFRPADIDFLRMGAARGLGTFDLRQVDVVGDEADRIARSWKKPRIWWARCNRDWRVSRDAQTGVRSWTSHVSFGDMLYGEKAFGGPAMAFAAAARVRADGHRKGFLWLGVNGKVTALLNGQQVMQEESVTRFRVGQFQQAVELRPGENQLMIRMEAVGERTPQVAALLVGQANNGDSLEGIEWLG